MNQWQRNLPVSVLVEKALSMREGVLTRNGALAVWTGDYTGRSPGDRFLVEDEATNGAIDWGAVNRPVARDVFDRLHRKMLDYLEGKELYVFDGYAGADPAYRVPVRVINEYAWHNLFIRQLLIRPGPSNSTPFQPQFTILSAPGLKADPEKDGTRSEVFIMIDLARGLGLIGGTEYAGEMKKMVFTLMNYLLPERGVLPMHCSANVGQHGDSALFFGLSGTGKTSLSADPDRQLIGDDEHGWSQSGIFNFEGGCYAKTIGLSREDEPQIWDAIRFGAVVENVELDKGSREIQFDSDRYTENARAAYPVEHIPNAVEDGIGGHPKTVIFLAADASGVLPPVAKLDLNQALYYFLSGYTSKLAGTERGVDQPEATFSACFGAPFLPRSPIVYTNLLGEQLQKSGASVYLVNTGWTGGPYGVGQRMPLPFTRAMIDAAVSGELDGVAMRVEEHFGLTVPTACPGVPADILDPRGTWDDQEAYDRQAKELAAVMRENFTQFDAVPPAVRDAGPRP